MNTTGKMTIRNPWSGIDYEVRMTKSTYQTNGNLAIALENFDEEYGYWEPYGNLTVNLGDPLPSDMAYVDTNNMPYARDFIARYNLGEPTGDVGISGFCCYPLYRFF